MKVEWYGHSCFKLTESTGTSVITDPFDDSVYDVPVLSSDLVTCTHRHHDHDNLSCFTNSPKVIDSVGMFEHEGITISSIKTYHDEKKGKLRGENLVFKYRIDGMDICHLGDIGQECSSKLVDLLMPVNILFVPVGGVYTIDAEQAKMYVDKLMPDIVIPMHYRTRNSRMTEIDKKDAFLRLFNDEDIIEVEDDYIILDRNDLDHESTKVYVLSRKKQYD